MRSPNIAGQTYALMIWTPIAPGREDELRDHLEGLDKDDSPLAKVPRTHMARWIIVADMPVAPGTDLADPLGTQFLLFTSNFDGDADSYLRELVELIPQEAAHRRALGTTRDAMKGAGGVRVLFRQDAELLDGAREHFGFADGFAQPAIEGATADRAAGGGVPERDGRWRPLAPGEFILGYPDEDTNVDSRRRLPAAPDGALGANATYMVWRKLHQDVALWRRTITAAAERYPYGDARKLAAKVVGRWQDGTPLETHPHGPDPEFDPAAPGANDFRYRHDRDGRRCPLGAHVRRSNPRDALDDGAKLSLRHRMIRRGMPYGKPLPDGELEDDGSERGLVFVSFQASIFRQFEGVQTPWINDGNIFGLGTDKDYLLGDPAGSGGKMTIQGRKPFFLAPQQPFVVTRGGEYLFVPGMAGLRAIVEGAA